MSQPPPSSAETLIFDRNGIVPHHFRSSRGVPADQIISIFGLDRLNASASAQFGRDDLRFAVDNDLHHPARYVIVDLRQEAHGFINGAPVSWYAPKNWLNRGKSKDWITQDEAKRLAELSQQTTALVRHVLDKDLSGSIGESDSVKVKVRDVQSEEELVTKDLGLEYVRFPVADHCPPPVDEVEAFLQFVRDFDRRREPWWPHFHCHGGDGRTSSFLVMYDMLRNARKVGFVDLLRRQQVRGSIDLFDLGTGWKNPLARERLRFLRCFFDYVREGGYHHGKRLGHWYHPRDPDAE